MADRDNFSEADKNILGSQVGWRCSNPECRAPTKGPHSDGARAVHVGIAAHIHAAAPGGPRYGRSQTQEQRASVENGIYLCETCGARIDKDAARFTADLLREWKSRAKKAADEELGKPTTSAEASQIVARLQGLLAGTTARLVYAMEGAGARVLDTFQIEVIEVDQAANVLRFKSLSGNLGPPDSMPLDDVENVWVHNDGTPRIRVSGYMEFAPMRPHRYVSRPRGNAGGTASPVTFASVPPMTPEAAHMMRLVGDEYEKSRFPPPEGWTIDGLRHEQKLKFELRAVGLLTVRPDGSCTLTAAGKDWIMWHRRPTAP